jgi:hypothetical protein
MKPTKDKHDLRPLLNKRHIVPPYVFPRPLSAIEEEAKENKKKWMPFIPPKK